MNSATRLISEEFLENRYRFSLTDDLEMLGSAYGNSPSNSGNLVQLKDANSHTTRYTYDGFDRLTRTTYADGSHEDSTYDAASNLTFRTTPAGQTLTYAYDALNRLTSKVTPEETTTSTYDLGSRLTSTSDGDVSLSYSYDARNSWCRWTADCADDASALPR